MPAPFGPIDLGAVLTEVAKYAAVGLVAFGAGLVSRWWRGYQNSNLLISELVTSMGEVKAKVESLKGDLDTRMDEMESRVNQRFAGLEGQFDDWGRGVHQWKNDTQAVVNRQEVRLEVLEERLRMFMLLSVGRERMEEMEALHARRTDREETQ